MKRSLLQLGNFKSTCLICLLSAVGFQQLVYAQQAGSSEALSLRQQADSIKYDDPQRSIQLLDDSKALFLKDGDTLEAVMTLVKKSEVLQNTGSYANSYDAYWNALLLTDHIEDDGVKSVIYYNLGRIYSYYRRKGDALDYLTKALNLQKKMVKDGTIQSSDIVPYYYTIASTYRGWDDAVSGQKYLDSAYALYSGKNPITPKAYLDFEKAYIQAERGEVKEAISLVEEVSQWFKEHQPSYMVLVNKYYADFLLKENRLSESEDRYKEALLISDEYNSHIDFTPLIYEGLTNLYLKKNDFPSAFASLKQAKDLDAQFFDGRSSKNQSLLEIKDDYRIEKERQQDVIQAQYLKQLEQEEEITTLQNVILLGSVIFIAIISIIYVRQLRIKHKTEKQLIRRNKELEIQKAQELLELKNKELAASALQLIEKDEFLKSLKEKIQAFDDKSKTNEVRKILRSISVTSNQQWEEFRLRFIDVNKDFYNKIFEKYPNLSQGDQKICALIKLNFSSKEMSRLLGISVESVHTSRHRIRKKMQLPRSVNLEDYINAL